MIATAEPESRQCHFLKSHARVFEFSRFFGQNPRQLMQGVMRGYVARVCGASGGMWSERRHLALFLVQNSKNLKTLNIENCFVALFRKSLPAIELTRVCPSHQHQLAHGARSPVGRLFSPKLD